MNTRKGFTLVELLVVIAILAILATVSVVGYTSFIEGADKQAAVSEAEQAKSIIDGGVVLNDYVKITSNQWVKYDTKTKTYSIAATDPKTTTVTVHDATADWTLKGVVSEVSGVLYYTINGYTVNLNTLEAAPATGE